MIDIRVVDGLYVITACKCTLVMTKRDFVKALRNGKWWRHCQQFAARQTPEAHRRRGR
jgi:hypothetical protein